MARRWSAQGPQVGVSGLRDRSVWVQPGLGRSLGEAVAAVWPADRWYRGCQGPLVTRAQLLWKQEPAGPREPRLLLGEAERPCVQRQDAGLEVPTV